MITSRDNFLKVRTLQKLPSFISKNESDSSLRKRCARTIYRNKYERNSQATRNWWQELFKTLEADASIPPDQQEAVLREIFPANLLQHILKIISSQDRKFKEEVDVVFKEELEAFTEKKIQRKSIKQKNEAPSDKRVSDKSMWDPLELAENRDNLNNKKKKIKRGALENVYGQVTGDVPKSKMYTDFFHRKPHRAAVWRTLPPLSLDEMNLNQKADAITEKIATDFIEWLRDLGGDEELSLSVAAVIAMFEIGFHTDSAFSLKVEVKEMPCISNKVAEARNIPQRAKRALLHREIKKDIKASKNKITLSAFGSRLPAEMQVRPPVESSYKKWLSCDKVPENLATMAAVWQGITHLKSTRAYCEFLIERPEIKPPKYLLDCGMLNLKNLREKDDKSDDLSLGDSLFSE